MKEEFNLSDEREQLRRSIAIENLNARQVLNFVELQDKEFIKILKKEIRVIEGDNDTNSEYDINCGHTLDLIDKLAGKDLIEKENDNGN